ncbi:hypothetical protein STVA_25900 [Allostella vacuolata]|nr:hypothetical protein STVA_25900 [Stella vacuolata]
MLTRDFRETVTERANRDPAFAKALLEEAATLSLNGEPRAARLILRDFVNASPRRADRDARGGGRVKPRS